jgi:hypothetical protein
VQASALVTLPCFWQWNMVAMPAISYVCDMPLMLVVFSFCFLFLCFFFKVHSRQWCVAWLWPRSAVSDSYSSACTIVVVVFSVQQPAMQSAWQGCWQCCCWGNRCWLHCCCRYELHTGGVQASALVTLAFLWHWQKVTMPARSYVCDMPLVLVVCGRQQCSRPASWQSCWLHCCCR